MYTNNKYTFCEKIRTLLKYTHYLDNQLQKRISTLMMMKMMMKIGLRQSGKREVNELYEWCEKRQKNVGWMEGKNCFNFMHGYTT